jgi:hypothetical protein
MQVGAFCVLADSGDGVEKKLTREKPSNAFKDFYCPKLFFSLSLHTDQVSKTFFFKQLFNSVGFLISPTPSVSLIFLLKLRHASKGQI